MSRNKTFLYTTPLYPKLIEFTSKTGRLKNLAESNGAQILYYSCDITDEATVGLLFEEAAEQARFPVRGLVTCAGITRVGPSIKFPLAEARRVIDINLVGTLAAAQAAARIVEKQALPASFVFIASMSGHIINKVWRHVKHSQE